MNNAKLYDNVYYFNTWRGANQHREKLIGWQDATPEARIVAFGRGYAIQEKRGGQ